MRGIGIGIGIGLVVVLGACAPSDDRAADGAADSTVVADTPAPGPAAAPAQEGMLDPDAATAEQLAALPGMTPELAGRLVAGRPFASMLAVDSVLAGALGEAQRDTIYTRLWKPLDLNGASAAEIELIPGVGPRMRREFEEYRPFADMAEFRREIGKYVDETEVARLERYVTIR